MEALVESQVVDDRYKLGPVIGRGGMADVRSAEDLRLGRLVALKSLRMELAEQDGVRERFADEARSAARLSHPNVVAVFDTGISGGVPYLVMECLPGASLADLIAEGPQEAGRVIQLGHEVLAALGAAHEAGLVHRDIKPANVLLTEDGTAKVADFGIAKSADAQTHTAAGVVMGTAGYLPPERLAGELATPRSDLYAVGVLLYELLAGCPPFAGDSPLVVASAIQRGEHRPLAELRPDLDPELVGVVERAMMADPASRFGTAGEMAEALRGRALPLSATATVAAEAPTTGLDAGEPTTERRATQVMAATTRPAEPDRPPLPPRRPARFSSARVLTGVLLIVVVAIGALVLAGRGDDSGGAPPGDEAVSTPVDGSLPPPLDRALDGLEAAVQP